MCKLKTRSIWKMLGPFATASRRMPPVVHCHSPGVATVARRHCRTPSKLVVFLRRCYNFSYFQDGYCRHLRFWNREILLAIGVQRVEMHQHAKFFQNRSVGCEYVKIFPFFKMAAWVLACMFQSSAVGPVQLVHPTGKSIRYRKGWWCGLFPNYLGQSCNFTNQFSDLVGTLY